MKPNETTDKDPLKGARLFLSCAEADRDEARRLVEALEQAGCQVEWHREFPGGSRWNHEIEARISSAYGVVVLWTPEAARSDWVKSEMSFAVGRMVPVFVALDGGPPPEGVVSTRQHIPRAELIPALRKALPAALRLAAEEGAPMRIARHPDDRAGLIGRAAAGIEEPQPVRQSAVFSSFCIPDEHPEHDAGRWSRRDGDSRSVGHRVKQFAERQALEKHARSAGARLIIAPRILNRPPEESRARLEELQRFLSGPASESVLVWNAGQVIRGNLTILGDRFLCESRSPGPQGFDYTTFTTHAPTILAAIEEFDARLERQAPDVLEDPAGSRENARNVIESLLSEL